MYNFESAAGNIAQALDADETHQQCKTLWTPGSHHSDISAGPMALTQAQTAAATL
jgi:hypothetical protein